MSKISFRLASLSCFVALFLYAGCIPGQRAGSSASSARAGVNAPLTREELRVRLANIESLIRDLDSSVRSMNAELASDLGLARAELSVLKAKIEAQDRWRMTMAAGNSGSSSSGRPVGAGADDSGDSGLPLPGGTVANLDQAGQQADRSDTLHPYYQTPPVATPEGSSTPASDAATGAGSVNPVTEESAVADGSGAATPGEARRLYDIAYQDLMRQNYQLALLNFRAFLERYPHTSLSDNAQYWIGEVYYAQRQFNISVEEFRKVVEEYPDQDKVPAAYYKIALCFNELHDQTTARRYLNYLIEHFGDSREADLARERLREW